jgi:hypothetical protein
LVLIGALTLVAIWYRAVQTAKATRAMERSSTITMDAEQGRLRTYWEWFIHFDSRPKGTEAAKTDHRLAHYFNWVCGNVGKTEIKGAKFISIKRLSDLPAKPNYSAAKKTMYQGEPLLPNRPTAQTEWFFTPLESALSYDEVETKYRIRNCFLYAYGYAKYRDVWQRLHEMRFGLMYDAQPTFDLELDTWVVAGPPDYNKS